MINNLFNLEALIAIKKDCGTPRHRRLNPYVVKAIRVFNNRKGKQMIEYLIESTKADFNYSYYEEELEMVEE